MRRKTERSGSIEIFAPAFASTPSITRNSVLVRRKHPQRQPKVKDRNHEDIELFANARVRFDSVGGATTDCDADKTSNTTLAHAPCPKTSDIGNSEIAAAAFLRLLR